MALGSRRLAQRPVGRHRSATLLSVALGAAVVILLLSSLPNGTASPIAGRTPRPLALPSATLSYTNGSTVAVLGSDFWGANLRPYYSLGTTQTQTYGASGLDLIRWPGGAVADRYNVTANLIYNDSGTSYAPPANASAFVRWCVSVSCSSIIGLPGEIDSPATAASYVAYYERVLHFTPDYFEIGNEPAVWTHYGVGWGGWNASQNLNATPGSYADLVHAYVAKIRSVDPTARIIGLPGLGTGAYGESTWIQATVAENGPNLSAISIHVYPAGGATGPNGTLAQFYATLSSPSSLGVRVPTDRAAIAAACPNCSIALIASELGSGTAGGPYDGWMNGFAVAPYLAQELVHAVSLNISSVDLYAFQSSYGGSILTPNGSATPSATLYQSLLVHLYPTVVLSTLATNASGLSAVVTQNALGTSFAVLAVNTNLTANLSIAVRPVNQTVTSGQLWTWSASASTPGRRVWTGLAPPPLMLAPESVAVLLVNSTVGRLHFVIPTLAGGLPPGLAMPDLTPGALLGMVAPTSMTFPCWALSRNRVERPVAPLASLARWLRADRRAPFQ